MAKNVKQHRVIFRDARGQFISAKDRYTPKVKQIQIFRGGQYVEVARRPVPPRDLVDLLNHREFESLPEALIPIKDYKSNKKYKAWDIAEQIDKTKTLRRKDLKFTMEIMDGNRKRTIEFYHRIKRNTASSYAIFRRINQELGLEGMFLYDKAGGKIMADRKGKQVRLLKIHVDAIE